MGKLLLKSIKKIVPITFGCMLGAILSYFVLKDNSIFPIKRVLTFCIISIISFFILTGIIWLYYIYKAKKETRNK